MIRVGSIYHTLLVLFPHSLCYASEEIICLEALRVQWLEAWDWRLEYHLFVV